MFIDKDSIVINGISIGQYLTEAKFSFNKLWGEDSGRNLRGDMIATLVGIFPKLELQFRPLSKTELEIISPILDSASQETTYYDPTLKRKCTMQTYSGDWSITNKSMMKNQGFSCSFISLRKRG